MGMSLTECEELARLLRIYRNELGDTHASIYERKQECLKELEACDHSIGDCNRNDEAAIRLQEDMKLRESGSR